MGKATLTGRKRYTDGKTIKYFVPGEQPECWFEGTPEETLKRQSAATQNMWKNDEFRNKQATSRATDEYRDKISGISKQSWEIDRDTRCKAISVGQKQRYASEEERRKASERVSALWQDPTYRDAQTDALQQSHKDLYSEHPEYLDRISLGNKKAWGDNKESILTKQFNTKTKNNSWNSSAPEDAYYEYLVSIYGADDIVRQYRDSRYPFYCDFYIKSEDKFIEYQGTWTHGGRPYDPDDVECEYQLNAWRIKAETSPFYKTAIKVWTETDPLKMKTAKKNNLNIEFIYQD